MPVLGICRGLQALNAAAGGTLRRRFRQHRTGETTCHTVDMAVDSLLGGFAGVRGGELTSPPGAGDSL